MVTFRPRLGLFKLALNYDYLLYYCIIVLYNTLSRIVQSLHIVLESGTLILIVRFCKILF